MRTVQALTPLVPLTWKFPGLSEEEIQSLANIQLYMTNSLRDYISYDPVLDEVIYNGDVASNSLVGQSFKVEFLLRNS